MSEASFAELLEDSLVTIHNGEIVEGTVIGVKDNEIILNIGYKADGISLALNNTHTSSSFLYKLKQSNIINKNNSKKLILSNYINLLYNCYS